jgi:hypothetical protein
VYIIFAILFNCKAINEWYSFHFPAFVLAGGHENNIILSAFYKTASKGKAGAMMILVKSKNNKYSGIVPAKKTASTRRARRTLFS